MHKCRQKGCPNTYTHVVGGIGAFGARMSGADCLPCFYAAQLLENGQTPEQIEAVPQIMELFLPHLTEAGWTWEHVKASFERRPEIL